MYIYIYIYNIYTSISVIYNREVQSSSVSSPGKKNLHRHCLWCLWQISGSVQYKVQFCDVQRSDNESFDGREAAEETEGRSLSPLVKTRGGREDPKKQLTWGSMLWETIFKTPVHCPLWSPGLIPQLSPSWVEGWAGRFKTKIVRAHLAKSKLPPGQATET